MLIFTNNVAQALDGLAESLGAPRAYVIADENTARAAVPLAIGPGSALAGAPVITIPAGDDNKNADSLLRIWSSLSELGATRRSLVVNIGGGMVTDIGGFAASAFKRGVRFVNVPTTLLGAVDAAVGGKTGINLNGLKNEVGAFADSEAVVISTLFFDTLPVEQLLSGYAEMLKHGLLDSPRALAELMAYDIAQERIGHAALLALVEKSVNFKKRVVEADPRESGLRKILNLGHTAGHAFESLAMRKGAPVPHGYAVAWGLVVELVLSHMRLGFPSETLHQLAAYVRERYGSPAVTCDDYPALLQLMAHDKKNATPSQINFTLLAGVGDPRIDQSAEAADITAALDIARDLLG